MQHKFASTKEILSAVKAGVVSIGEGASLLKRFKAKGGETLFFMPQWVAAPAQERLLSGNMLVVNGSENVIHELRNVVQGRVITISETERYEQANADELSFPLLEADGYGKLDEYLRVRKITIATVCIFTDAIRGSSNNNNEVSYSIARIAVLLLKVLNARALMSKMRILFIGSTRHAADRKESSSTCAFEALRGMVMSIPLENPSLHCSAVELDRESLEDIVAILSRESFHTAPIVRYTKRKRFEYALKRVQPVQSQSPFQTQGSYIITGGLGGLGSIIAKHLLEKYKAKLLLTGRSALNDERIGSITRLRENGGEIEYRQLDIRERGATEECLRFARERYGEISGIIHCAGVINDNYLVGKSQQEIVDILSPKIEGVHNLHVASRDDDLRCFILFSSLAAVIGNAGQCDYAYANSYLDAFAYWREEECRKGRCSGRTLAINWPYWSSGGMRTSEKIVQYQKENYGLLPLGEKKGMEALYRAWGLNGPNIVICEGYEDKLCSMMRDRKLLSDGRKSRSILRTKNGQEENEEAILAICAKLLKMKPQELDPNVAFIEYGFDSMMTADIANHLRKATGKPLQPSLIAQYDSARALARYLNANGIALKIPA
jgi:acyl carrier protein